MLKPAGVATVAGVQRSSAAGIPAGLASMSLLPTAFDRWKWLYPDAVGTRSISEPNGVERCIAKIMTATVAGTEVSMSVGMLPISGLFAVKALLVLVVPTNKFAAPLGYSKSPRSASDGS